MTKNQIKVYFKLPAKTWNLKEYYTWFIQLILIFSSMAYNPSNTGRKKYKNILILNKNSNILFIGFRLGKSKKKKIVFNKTRESTSEWRNHGMTSIYGAENRDITNMQINVVEKLLSPTKPSHQPTSFTPNEKSINIQNQKFLMRTFKERKYSAFDGKSSLIILKNCKVIGKCLRNNPYYLTFFDRYSR